MAFGAGSIGGIVGVVGSLPRAMEDWQWPDTGSGTRRARLWSWLSISSHPVQVVVEKRGFGAGGQFRGSGSFPLEVFVNLRLDGVQRQVLPAILGLERSQGKAVLY